MTSKDAVIALDWDQLLSAIDIEIDDYADTVPIISDFMVDGMTRNILVSFDLDQSI